MSLAAPRRRHASIQGEKGEREEKGKKRRAATSGVIFPLKMPVFVFREHSSRKREGEGRKKKKKRRRASSALSSLPEGSDSTGGDGGEGKRGEGGEKKKSWLSRATQNSKEPCASPQGIRRREGKGERKKEKGRGRRAWESSVVRLRSGGWEKEKRGTKHLVMTFG